MDEGKRIMQSSFLSISMDNGYAEHFGRLVIGNNDDRDDSCYLECGDCLYNISNLFSEQSLKMSRSAQYSAAPVSIRKQIEERIYPSRHHVESIGDVDIGMVFASKARLLQGTESGVVGHDEGRGPSATKHRDSTSGYFANSERNIFHSRIGNVSSRSIVLINSDDRDIDQSSYGNVSSRSVVLINNSDTDIDINYNYQLEVKITAPSTIDRDSDDYQRYPNSASFPKEDLNLPAVGGQIEVEIMPGVFAPLRGSEETWRAVKAGNIEIVVCICCCNRIQCIADAEYILCPECRVVSPVGNRCRGSPASGQHKSRGVGLGLLAPAA
jgi:hypothetical protein